MITTTSFKTRYPEFTSVDDSRLQIIIDEAYLFVGGFGTLKDLACNYLTAHLLTVSINQTNGQSSSNQTIASKSVGSVSVSFMGAVTNGSDSFYSSTSYGQLYLDLKKRVSKGNIKLV